MSLTKALLIDTDAKLTIPVMFNPPDYQLQKTNQFAEIGIPGLGSSQLQFVRGGAQTLTMELFFDTSDFKLGLPRHDVREFTEAVVGLTVQNAKTHAPPKLLFIWGSLAFSCVLESVTQRYDYFDVTGIPLRARLTVTLKGHDPLEGLLASIPLESADRTKFRVVKAGETLQSIAAQEYDDPRKWRPIAQANNIDNPLTIPIGQRLIVPSLT